MKTQLFSKINNSKSFIWVGISLLLMIFVILPEAEQSLKIWSKGSGTFEQAIFFSSSEMYGTLFQFGLEGRQTYLFLMLTAYLIFPILYGIFFYWILQSLFQHINSSNKKYLTKLPFLIAFFDISDNLLMSFIICQYPIEWTLTGKLLAILCFLKWSLFFCFFLGLILGCYIRIKNIIKK